MALHSKQIFWWVFGTHAGVIFLLLVTPLLRGCFHREPKEVVMEIGIAEPTPSTADPILPSIQPEPAPEPEPTPEPTPEPAPEPTPIPEPEKTKPEPEPEPEKPKWKPRKVVRQDRRVTRQTPQPKPAAPSKPDLSDLQEELGSLAADPDDAYYGKIQPRFDSVWQQPPSTPYGTKATATIRVNSRGQITYSALSAPSGNAAFDRSVQAALRATGQLPAPPKSLVNRDILIYFELD